MTWINWIQKKYYEYMMAYYKIKIGMELAKLKKVKKEKDDILKRLNE